MTSICYNTQSRIPARPIQAPSRSFWQAMRHAADLARQRRALGALEAHMLADIGLSRQEAQCEAARPFWDAP